jgi:acetyl-CoA carboxylase carboxyl transferase subunit alpha
VIEEPLGGAHRDYRQMSGRMKIYLLRTLKELLAKPVEELIAQRYQKFREMGVYLERTEAEAVRGNGAPGATAADAHSPLANSVAH